MPLPAIGEISYQRNCFVFKFIILMVNALYVPEMYRSCVLLSYIYKATKRIQFVEISPNDILSGTIYRAVFHKSTCREVKAFNELQDVVLHQIHILLSS